MLDGGIWRGVRCIVRCVRGDTPVEYSQDESAFFSGFGREELQECETQQEERKGGLMTCPVVEPLERAERYQEVGPDKWDGDMQLWGQQSLQEVFGTLSTCYELTQRGNAMNAHLFELLSIGAKCEISEALSGGQGGNVVDPGAELVEHVEGACDGLTWVVRVLDTRTLTAAVPTSLSVAVSSSGMRHPATESLSRRRNV